MDPLITLSSLGASLKLIDIFAKQFSTLFVKAPPPSVDNQLADNDLIIKTDGIVQERITAFDIDTLDDESKQLIRALERSVKKNFRRWTAIYQKIADTDDPEIIERYRAKLYDVSKQMCHDLDLLLGYFEKLGKRIDKYYMHVRFHLQRSEFYPRPIPFLMEAIYAVEKNSRNLDRGY